MVINVLVFAVIFVSVFLFFKERFDNQSEEE